jgi:hypothetical protein
MSPHALNVTDMKSTKSTKVLLVKQTDITETAGNRSYETTSAHESAVPREQTNIVARETVRNGAAPEKTRPTKLTEMDTNIALLVQYLVIDDGVKPKLLCKNTLFRPLYFVIYD